MKILAASTPNYFPGLSFFLKMHLADLFVIADDLQYSTNSMINRTKIRTATGWQWLTVPVHSSGKLKQRINKAKIVRENPWHRKHLRIIKSNYKYAPYFDYFETVLVDLFQSKWEMLSELNTHIISHFKERLKIMTPVHLSSEINSNKNGTENIIALVKYFDCDHYLISEDELNFININQLKDAGISLVIKKFETPEYYQQFQPFEPGMSILDLFLNKGNESMDIIVSGVKDN